MDPKTFSSEFEGVHETRRQGDSFSSEFRGASDSLIERRPPPLDTGRRGRRVVLLLIVFVGLLGGGGWAFWYGSEEIGTWIAGLNAQTEPDAEAEAESEAEAEAEPAEPDPVFGVRGEPGETLPSSPENPPPASAPPRDPPPSAPDSAPAPTPPPSAQPRVEVLAKEVGGKVSRARIDQQHAKVQTALEACWAKEHAAGRGQPVELSLSFRIRWTGRRTGVKAEGGSDALRACAREAVPGGGWPEPRDGGEGRVRWSWKLG